MEYGQLIEYTIYVCVYIYIHVSFWKRYTQNGVKKLFPDLFLKNQNWAYLWIDCIKFYTECFYRMASWGLSKQTIETLKLSYRPLTFTSYKAFLKIKTGLELVSLPHLLHDFWRKIFLLWHSFTRPNFKVWLSLLPEILGNMCIAIFS